MEAEMQRFFFDLHSRNVVMRDREGLMMPDIQAATASATTSLRELAAEHLRSNRRLLITSIRIIDEHRRAVGEVTVEEAVLPILQP